MIKFRELTKIPESGNTTAPGRETLRYNSTTSTKFVSLEEPIFKTEDRIPKNKTQIRNLRGLQTPVSENHIKTKSRESLYEEAHVYLNRVLLAVRNQSRFDLTRGLRIMQEIVERLSPNDEILIHAIHSENLYSYVVGHSVNVAIFATLMGKSLGYSKEKMIEVGLVGLLHDVGMGLIPEEIIYKKGSLTKQEYDVMKQRPFYSFKILEKFRDQYPYLAECALQVCERVDGSGYPKALKGDEIHEYAQIVGLAAVYEALIHSRPQREKFLHFVAAKEIIKTGKKAFKTEHLKALLKIFSIFPLNTTVRLNSGAIGRVMETYPDQPMRPKLQILYDSQKREVLTKRIIDLPENSLLYIVDAVSDEELFELSGDLDKNETAFSDGRTLVSGSMGPAIESDKIANDQAGNDPKPDKNETGGRRGGLRHGTMLWIMAGAVLIFLMGMGVVALRSSHTEPLEKESASDMRYDIRNLPEKKQPPQINEPESSAAATDPASKTDASGSEQSTGEPILNISRVPDDLDRDKMVDASFQEGDSIALDAGVSAMKSTGEKAVTGENGGRPFTDPAVRSGQMRSPAVAPEMIEGDGTSEQEQVRVAQESGGQPGDTKSMALSSEDGEAAYPISVKLASLKTREEAQRALPEWIGKGENAYWVRVNLGTDGIWYRIFAGHFKRIEDAQAFIEERKLPGAVAKTTRFSTVVGKYADRETAESKVQEILAKGYSPYLIQRVNSGFFVYVGAFYTRKGAEEQAEALTKAGIWNKVVER